MEVIQQNKEQIDLNRMLSIDNIIQSLNINQKHIENCFFEKLFNFEKKKDYNFEENKSEDLFKVSLNSGYRSNFIKLDKNKQKSLFSNNSQSKNNIITTSLFTSNSNKINNNNNDNENKKKTSYNIDSTSNNMNKTENDLTQRLEQSSNQFYKKLLNAFKVIYENEFADYSIIQSKYHIKNYVFTFLSSVFTIFNEEFILKNEKEREMEIKSCLKKMHDTSVSEGNYQKFFYHRNRKFKKEIFHSVMNKALSGKIELDEFYIIQQYVCDFFGINIFIFFILPTGEIDFTKSSYFATKQFKGRMNPYVPNICLLYSNELYYPIVHKTEESESILMLSKKENILKNIWQYLNIDELLNFKDIDESSSEDEDEIKDELENTESPVVKKFKQNELTKLKLEELQILANENNVLITKASEKTGKQIKKIKSELIDDLLKI